MHILHDDDEWMPTFSHTPCTACNGDINKCNGRCNGSSSYGLVRRPAAEVAKIKADRRRQEEDDILAKAEIIKLHRATAP